jgi:hypothetical protein
MKKIITMALIVMAMTFSTQAFGQKFSGLDKSPADIASYPARGAEKTLKIVYGRPQLKGRSLANLTPNGAVWRTGANEATEITFYTDVTLGGEKVAEGTYSLFTIPNNGEWTIILNSALNQWGSYSYDESADVLRTTAKTKTADKNIEAFSITFEDADNGANMYMGWGNTIVTVPIGF